MTQPNLLSLAKQGDTRALTSLLNRSLQPRGITAKATKRDEQLHILLEAEAIPSKPASVRCIQQGLEKLELVNIPVNIYGRQQGQTRISWQEYLAAPIRSASPEDSLFDAELLEDGDFLGSGSGKAAEPLGGEPTQVSEDWSEQATALEISETADAARPPAPPPPSISLDSSANWDNFELDATAKKGDQSTGFGAPASPAWGAGMPVDYSPEEADPTLIVPDEGEDDMDAGLNDEDADSEILLSLWDDANLDDDIEPSGDLSAENLSLWQEGESTRGNGTSPSVLSDEPMRVGGSGAARTHKQSSSCLPLVLLGSLAMLVGVAAAAYLNQPWLANVPVVGPLLSSGAPKAVESTTTGDSPTKTPVKTPVKTPAQTPAPASSEKADATPSEPTSAEPDPIAAPAETAVSSADPFRAAVNDATEAAGLAQTASSPESWAQVAESWERAVKNMQAVPSDHPKYDVAQQKIPEYQVYLDYAQQQL